MSSETNLIKQIPLFQVNLYNFEHDVEKGAEMHNREKRWSEIETKWRQILSLREQIYQIRFSSLEKEGVRETLTSLFNELHRKEAELEALQERDRERFLESLKMDDIDIGSQEILKKPSEGTLPRDVSLQSFELASNLDIVPRESVHPRKRWKNLITRGIAATKFMRLQNQVRNNRAQKIKHYLKSDPCRHPSGKTLTKSELRERIDDIRAILKELKEAKAEEVDDEIVLKLTKQLREMNSLYSELLLQENNLGFDVMAY